MDEVTRRDAVKLAAAGVVAVGMTAATGAGTHADDKKSAADASGKQIEGIKLPATLGAAMNGTPEDAARAFLKAATIGMAQVMADAIAAAAGEAVGGAAAPPDWLKLIKGCVGQIKWESPGKTSLQTAVAVATNAAAGGGVPALGGIGFSAGITGTF